MSAVESPNSGRAVADRERHRRRILARVFRRAAGAVIEKAITVRHPRIRYRIGVPVRLLRPQRVLFGERAWEKFVRTFFPTP